MARFTPEQIKDMEERTTSFGLLRYANEYQRASVVVKEQDNASVVPYMLLAHSLELALKAYLRTRGATLDELRLLGHSLPDLHREALDRSIGRLWPQAAELLPTLELLDAANHRQGLRYIITGVTHYPDWTAATSLAEGLIAALIEPCLSGTLGEAAAAMALRNRGPSNVFPKVVTRVDG